MSSYPIHHQLFEIMGFKAPRYVHISPIMKLDGDSKRKLSKRKDPEAAARFYIEQGYPVEGVIEYLLTIANSNYEEWRMKNPEKDYNEFSLSLKKMSVSGALFDLNKLSNICKEVIAKKAPEQIFDEIKVWASNYNDKLHLYIKEHPDKFKQTILLWKFTGKKVRKDIDKWADLLTQYSYLYNDEENVIESYEFDDKILSTDLIEFLEMYLSEFKYDVNSEEWFENMKGGDGSNIIDILLILK